MNIRRRSKVGDEIEVLASDCSLAEEHKNNIMMDAIHAEGFVYVPYTNQCNDVADRMRELYENLIKAYQRYSSLLELDADAIYRLATDFDEFDKHVHG